MEIYLYNYYIHITITAWCTLVSSYFHTKYVCNLLSHVQKRFLSVHANMLYMWPRQCLKPLLSHPLGRVRKILQTLNCKWFKPWTLLRVWTLNPKPYLGFEPKTLRPRRQGCLGCKSMPEEKQNHEKPIKNKRKYIFFF